MARRSWFWWLGGLALLGWACSLGPPKLTLRRAGLHTPRVVTVTSSPSPRPPRPTASPRPTALPQPTPLPQPTERGSLLPPLSAWEPWARQGPLLRGHNRIGWAEAAPYGQVADFRRQDGEDDSGGAGLYLSLDLDLSPYDHLYLQVVGRILEERGANLAGARPPGPLDSGLQVQLRYQTADGQTRGWYHGFYITPLEGADAAHFSLVPAGEWFTWTSDDLLAWPEPPARLVRVWVYGSGWAFHSQVAAVYLTPAPRPEP